MRTHFPNIPTSLRSEAEFFQRLARASRFLWLREKLEELSLQSMEEATELERDLAIPPAPHEIAQAGAYEEQDRC